VAAGAVALRAANTRGERAAAPEIGSELDPSFEPV
jgi:hypothetical protein